MARGRKEPWEKRFADRVDMSGGPDSCWPWTGGRNASGYGRLGVGRDMKFAHRLAYELKHGPLMPGVDVLHQCDNPPCCNWAHLRAGSQSQNMAEMTARGRRVRGSDVGGAKLDEVSILQMRERYAHGETLKVLARAFHVTHTQVSHVVRGKCWAHLGGPLASGPGRQCKIDRETAQEIRAWYAVGGWRQSDIAEAFGVSTALVGQIHRGDVWR